MSAKKLFAPEEMEELRKNKYTSRVTANSISYTNAFKKAFWELSVKGYTGTAAFRALGYDPDMLGFERVHNTTKRIRRAAQAPEGLEEKPAFRMRISKGHFKEAELGRMSHKEAAKRMQKEIVYLQQQVEFLKKSCSGTAPPNRRRDHEQAWG